MDRRKKRRPSPSDLERESHNKTRKGTFPAVSRAAGVHGGLDVLKRIGIDGGREALMKLDYVGDAVATQIMEEIRGERSLVVNHPVVRDSAAGPSAAAAPPPPSAASPPSPPPPPDKYKEELVRRVKRVLTKKKGATFAKDFEKNLGHWKRGANPSWRELLESFSLVESFQSLTKGGDTFVDEWVIALYKRAATAVQRNNDHLFPGEDLSLPIADVSRDPAGFLAPLIFKRVKNDEKVIRKRAAAIGDVASKSHKVDDPESEWWSPGADQRMRLHGRTFFFRNSGDTVRLATSILSSFPGMSLRHLNECCEEGWLVGFEKGADGKLRRTFRVDEKTLIAKTDIYKLELSIFVSIQRLCGQDDNRRGDWDINLEAADPFEGCDSEQRKAGRLALTEPLVAVLGPGGCGKTSRVARSVWRACGEENVAGLAPTHVAKNRLIEELGLPRGSGAVRTAASFICDLHGGGGATTLLAKRIDEAIERGASRFEILLDECSMINLADMEKILRIAASRIRAIYVAVVFFGDEHQLPPISSGSPFADIVECGEAFVKRARLDKVYRTESIPLVEFCKRLRTPDYSLDPTDDDCLQNVANRNGGHVYTFFRNSGLNESVKEALRQRPWSQIVTHQNKDCLRFSHFARMARGSSHQPRPNEHFALGDEVLFRKNATHWRNGDVAVIERRKDDRSTESYAVSFEPAEEIRRDPDEEDLSENKPYRDSTICAGKDLIDVHCDDIIPSSARTVHKCQGSGFDDVIFVMDSLEGKSSNFNYTACSRAKKSLTLIGPRSAFDGQRARTKEVRQTLLQELFRDSFDVNLKEELGRLNKLMCRRDVDVREKLSALRDRHHGEAGSCRDCSAEISLETGFFLDKRDDALMCRRCHSQRT